MKRTSQLGGDSRRRPLAEQRPADPPILAALRYGVTAPSAHNSQPWRIEIFSDTEARLLIDPRRSLPEVDPLGRQLEISQGTLLETTAIAASGLGFRADVEVVRDDVTPAAAAGERPIATIRLVRDPSTRVDPLFTSIRDRRTSRLAHQEPPLTGRERARIEADSRIPGVDVGWVRAERLTDALRVAGDAMAIEAGDRDRYDETRRWFRFSRREIERTGDGLNIDTVGLSGPALVLGRLFTTRRTWHASINREAYVAGFRRASGATTDLLTLATETDTVCARIAAGRSYVRADLSATALGLRCHPISQSLEEFGQMDELRTRMQGLTGSEPPAKVQMLVRVGRSATPALSSRRPLRELLL